MKKQTFYIFLIMSFVFLLGIPKTYATEFTSVEFKPDIEIPQAFEAFRVQYPNVLTDEWKQNLIDSINQKYPQPYKISFIRFACSTTGGFSYGTCSSSNSGAGYVLFINTYIFNSQPNLYYRLYNDTYNTFKLEGDTTNRDIYYFATSRSGYSVDALTGTLTGNQQNVLGTNFISYQTSKAFAPILYLKDSSNSVFYYNFNGITSNVELPPSPTNFSNDTIQLTPNILLSPNSTIKLENFINPLFQEDSEPAYEPINRGLFKTDKFAYIIKDFELGSNKSLEFNFNFLNNVDTDDINLYFNSNDNFIQSDYTCEYIENTYSDCHFNITYDVNNDRGITLFFEFDSSHSFTFFDNDTLNQNSAFELNSDNIKEYSIYKEIDITNKKGLLFYPNDSRYMKFIPLDTEFNFIGIQPICGILGCSYIDSIDSDSLKTLSYSNTYLSYDVDNDTYSIPTTSFFTPVSNKLGSKVYFDYDLNILDVNQYSSFVVLNNNVVDSLNDQTNNPGLKVKYNSSLFTYNNLNTQTIVNNGVVTEKVVVAPGSLNIIDNTGNSHTQIIDNTTIGTELFGDVDISSYYKDSLDYFQDKVISFFDLISDFYNSLPVKVKYFFVLMFMFIVGFIIVKLFV